jgi:hypothetical protein
MLQFLKLAINVLRESLFAYGSVWIVEVVIRSPAIGHRSTTEKHNGNHGIASYETTGGRTRSAAQSLDCSHDRCITL